MASAPKTAIAQRLSGRCSLPSQKKITPFFRPLNRSHTDNTHRSLGAIPPPPPCCASPTTQPYSQRCHASAISTNHTEQRRLKHGHEMRSRRDEATKASSFSRSLSLLVEETRLLVPRTPASLTQQRQQQQNALATHSAHTGTGSPSYNTDAE